MMKTAAFSYIPPATRCLVLLGVMVLLTGIIYPHFVTLIAQIVFLIRLTAA
jgi:K+-transporting ATPase c subunit